MLLLTSLLVVAAAAPAPSVAAPVAFAQPSAGGRVHWSLTTARATLAPGAVVRIRVTTPRRDAAPVTVALTRTDGADGPRLVAQRRLRSGSVRLRVPRATGARFVITARAGGRTLRRAVIVTPRRVGPPDQPAPGPVVQPPTAAPSEPTPREGGFGPIPLPPGCPASYDSAATVRLDRATAANGDAITVTMTNSGASCLYDSGFFRLHRESGGDAIEVPQPPAERILHMPGGSRSFTFVVPAADRVPAGRYLVDLNLWRPPTSDAVMAVAASAGFEVVSGGAGGG